MLHTIVESALKGKLAPQEFPILNGNNPLAPASNVIIFVVGGATFEEAKEIATSFNLSSGPEGIRVILGGNTIHNSKSFMADISQIQMIKGTTEMLKFEIE
jgi:vacuolar protein sorting-associated protein 45